MRCKDLPANSVFYYFSDHLKKASVITDSSGTIKAESDYYPWGGELQLVNNDTNDYKFAGKKRDIETGLDYFGARYYSNGLGRFVSSDWSPTPEAVPYADLNDPQSLNLYTYVRDLPTSRTDPDGHGLWNKVRCLFGSADACKAQAKEDAEKEKQKEAERRQQQIRNARFYAGEWAKECKCNFDPNKYSDDQILQAYQRGAFSKTAHDPLDPLQLLGIITVAPAAGRVVYRDSTGRIHDDIPEYPDSKMTKAELEEQAHELRESIKAREIDNAQKGGDSSPKGPAHRAQIDRERFYLRQIENRLKGQ